MAINRDTSSFFRLVFFLVALAIIAASTWFSNNLGKELAKEEQKKIELWAEAIRLLAQEPEPGEEDIRFDYSLTLKVIEGNTNIPVILTDDQNNIQSYANLKLSKKNPEADLQIKAAYLIQKNRQIRVKLDENTSQYVYYDDSDLLKKLRYFPFVQLGVMFVFLAVTLVSLTVFKRSEQNRVWVGLSKETAHQLGTPISSLLAWVELLKLKEIDPALLTEMEKDTHRLRTIAERFSKIGSRPDAEYHALAPVLENAVNYLRGRSSQKIRFQTHSPKEDLSVSLNIPLFEWVIENLCKNSIDAMNGEGQIDIIVAEGKKQVFIDVCDDGKGIPKKHFKAIFRPGFTTKARGWGLGLSLVKRIVEEYHKGKIFVKNSEPGKGACIRIILRKELKS